jgi:hypothetical protein
MITHESELITIPWTPNLDMRKVMVANCHAIIGYHGGDQETEKAFQHLLGPSKAGNYDIWPLDKAYGRGGMSTCAMVALGLLRRLGVACVDIMDGYHDNMGSGLRVAINWARGLDPRPAWIRPQYGLRPEPGDIVQVLGPMHALTVVGWEESPDGTLMCVSVDGGQAHPVDGLQCVTLRKRPWIETPTSARLGGRECDGWIDVDLLQYSGPVTAPKGWEAMSIVSV